MKAIIIAGGKGERLRPLTNKIPKPMIEVSGKPILEHIINLFKKNGIKDIIIALCYLPGPIINYFKDGSRFGVNIDYIYENPRKPKGTAGAIISAEKLLSDTFIVTYADILRNLNIKEMMKSHRKSNSLATLNIYKHTGENFKSSIKFNKDRILTKFKELNNSTKLKYDFAWSNGAFYIFEPKIFKYIPKNKKVDFSKDIFPKLLSKKEKISVFPSYEYIQDIGTKESLEKVKKINLSI